ncbi:MAG: transaldolase [Candidatus Omnitrophica bacterium]|nr:transaldolase [Candidatus Omnitrophota bacterium]
MGIFLDTGNVDEIKKYLAMGILRGVTTNPTLLVREGLPAGGEAVRERVVGIAKLIAPLPLSVEVLNNDPAGMRAQAQEFSGWADNINIKIPIHGPEGELDNLALIHECETKLNLRINVTAMMAAQQGLVAAMAGATYVSIFGGRVQDIGYDACEEISKLRNLIDRLGLKAKIIVGSTREVFNIIQWFDAGAHIVTATPKLVEGMIVHPHSKETVRQFVRDGARLSR